MLLSFVCLGSLLGEVDPVRAEDPGMPGRITAEVRCGPSATHAGGRLRGWEIPTALDEEACFPLSPPMDGIWSGSVGQLSTLYGALPWLSLIIFTLP